MHFPSEVKKMSVSTCITRQEKRLTFPTVTRMLLSLSEKCLISCISHLPALIWTFTVWTKEHNRSTLPHIFVDSDTENWWDYMHWCHVSTTNKMHTHTDGTFFRQSWGEGLISCSERLWGKWASTVCRILLAFWELPFVFSKGAGTLEVKYSVIDPDWTMDERAS